MLEEQLKFELPTLATRCEITVLDIIDGTLFSFNIGLLELFCRYLLVVLQLLGTLMVGSQNKKKKDGRNKIKEIGIYKNYSKEKCQHT